MQQDAINITLKQGKLLGKICLNEEFHHLGYNAV
jgi:hypothetical protein